MLCHYISRRGSAHKRVAVCSELESVCRTSTECQIHEVTVPKTVFQNIGFSRPAAGRPPFFLPSVLLPRTYPPNPNSWNLHSPIGEQSNLCLWAFRVRSRCVWFLHFSPCARARICSGLKLCIPIVSYRCQRSFQLFAPLRAKEGWPRGCISVGLPHVPHVKCCPNEIWHATAAPRFLVCSLPYVLSNFLLFDTD